MRWIAEEPKFLAQRRTLISQRNRDSDQGRGVVLGCFLGDELIGSAGLHRRRPDARSLEIGYWIDAAHEGHGYATELTLLLGQVAFTHAEIENVAIYCDDVNERSSAVAIRSGFPSVETNPTAIEGTPSPGESGMERHYVLGHAQFDSEWRRTFQPQITVFCRPSTDF